MTLKASRSVILSPSLPAFPLFLCHCLLDSPYSTVCASTSSSPSTSLSAPALLLSPPSPTSTLLPSLLRSGNRRFHIPRSARRTPPLVTHLATQRSILLQSCPLLTTLDTTSFFLTPHINPYSSSISLPKLSGPLTEKQS